MENFVHETAGDPNVPPYVINDEEVSEEDFNSRKEKWNQISSHFVTIIYDLMTDITDTTLAAVPASHRAASNLAASGDTTR